MLNNEYLRPGLAALALAIMVPLFWGYQILSTESDLESAYFASVTSLDFTDLIFLLLGALEIYVFFSVKRILNDRSNFKSVDVLIWLIIANSALYYFGNLGIDLSIYLTNSMSIETQETLATASYYLSLGCIFVFGLLDLALAIILMINYKTIPVLLRVFSAAILILGICELAFFFKSMLVLYPIVLLVLAINFLQKPQSIEVV